MTWLAGSHSSVPQSGHFTSTRSSIVISRIAWYNFAPEWAPCEAMRLFSSRHILFLRFTYLTLHRTSQWPHLRLPAPFFSLSYFCHVAEIAQLHGLDPFSIIHIALDPFSIFHIARPNLNRCADPCTVFNHMFLQMFLSSLPSLRLGIPNSFCFLLRLSVHDVAATQLLYYGMNIVLRWHWLMGRRVCILNLEGGCTHLKPKSPKIK